MTISVKHTFQSAKPDGTDATLIQPSNWNEEHTLTLATNKILGRITAGTGAVEEIGPGTGLGLSGGNLNITTVPAANGGTGANTLAANSVLLGNGTSPVQTVAPGAVGNVLTSDGTTWVAQPPGSTGYPQNIQSANYTLVLSDAGKQIFHPASDTATRTYTIPANASVAFPIGTVVLFTVENGGYPVSVAITSDTLVAGSGTTGTITVPRNNTLMCIKVTATKWMANYLYQTGISSPQAIAIAHATTPFVTAYQWSNLGFGNKYTNPATLPVSTGYSVAFSPSGNAIAVTNVTAPSIVAYPWSSSGFGVKFANPATLPGFIADGVAFSPAGNAIAVTHSSSPYVNVYPWSSSGFGTKFADPATAVAGQANGVAFNPAGDAIAVAHYNTPYVSVYAWSGSGFGAKFADPATLPASTGFGVTFNPSGNAIAVAHDASPYVSAYPWSGSGFGTKFSNPATLPTGTGNEVAFSPAGDALAVAHITSPFVSVYPWSGSGFGSKFTNPATLPTGDGYGVAFNPAGDAIAIAHTTTPFITAYPWGSSGFGVKFANPAVLPAGNGAGVAFNLNP